MYAKLALRNIRRSLHDYGIYFLTLVFAVAIFYVFNSLGDQPALLTLRSSTRRLAEGALQAMNYLTYLMTGVVAFLVFYANRVIVKKRSRELGTYLLLGMEQGRLALLLLGEVLTVGVAALAVGLISGLFLSQFFARVVAQVFGASLTGHPFVFSTTAAVRTLISYGLVFVLVGLWQAAALYRQKLIDLINAARKSEQIRLRSRWLTRVAGLFCAGSLGTAYWLSDQVSRDLGLSPSDPRILIGALLGVVGTYLLFLALAGLVSRVRQRRGGWLSRGLNLFLFRQVTSKINTHAGLLATIALMLTFTICAMSFGLGLGRGMAERAEEEAPFDYLFFSVTPDDEFPTAVARFDEYGVADRRMVRFATADTEIRGMDLMLPEDRHLFEGDGISEFVAHVRAKIIPFSAYQELRALKGYPAAELPEGHYLIHYSGEQTIQAKKAREVYGRFMSSGATVELAGRTLKPGASSVYFEAMGSHLTGHAALLVLPDDVAAALPQQFSYLVVEVAGTAPEALDEALGPGRHEGGFAVTIRAELVGHGFVYEGILLFLTFYIGIMFILISATLLALQQVTDAVEHRQRFEVLRKLGADDRMIDAAIAKQLGLYFLTPVAVALLHSLVAMVALARLFLMGGGYTTVWPATLLTLGIFTLIYGAYYLISLQSCRTLFREAHSG